MSEPSQIAKDAAEGFNTAKPVSWTTWDSFAGRQIAHSKQPSLAAWIQLALDHSNAEKDKTIDVLKREISVLCEQRALRDKKIAELQESLQMSQAARREWLSVFDDYKATIRQQQQRLSEARFFIERISANEPSAVITAARKWLEKTP